MFTQGRDKGLRERCRNRGSLYNRDNARLSPHLSVITLGCLDGREKWGIGQSCYPHEYECNGEHEYFQGVDNR